MKQLIVLILSLLTTIGAAAQPTRNIGIELLGSNAIRYDSRFSGSNGLGFSAGLGYGYSNSSGVSGRVVTNQILVPVEINYLFFKSNHHLVLGAGCAMGVAFTRNESISGPQKSVYPGFSPFLDLAYRYQKPEGFSFSVGLKPCRGHVIWPYIGFGWSF